MTRLGLMRPYGIEVPRAPGWYYLTEKGVYFLTEYLEELQIEAEEARRQIDWIRDYRELNL